MKQSINQKGLTNIEDIKAETVNYWDTMIHDFLSSLIEIMPRRIEACIHARGDLTKYWHLFLSIPLRKWHLCKTLKVAFICVLMVNFDHLLFSIILG